jgi:hypothetical protein
MGPHSSTISVEEAVSLVLVDSDGDLSHKDGLFNPFLGSYWSGIKHVKGLRVRSVSGTVNSL